MPRTPHPLFLRVAENHRWTGPLTELLPALRKEAFRLAADATEGDRVLDRDFAWVVLPGGAVVGLRIRGDLWMRKELRIARQEAPQKARGAQAWEQEVAVFLRHFGVTALDGEAPAEPGGWLRQEPHANDVVKGGAAVRFLELRHGEIRPGWAHCHDCLLETGEIHLKEWFPGGGITGQRCGDHAAAAGGRYTQRILRLVS